MGFADEGGSGLTAVSELMEPIAADSPCGPDLEYDPEFLALEQAAQGKPEQVLGSTVIPKEEPDWDDVARRAKALLGRSKDLRVATLYARALTRRGNLAGLATGLAVISQFLDRYWDAVHPRPAPDEGQDPTMRLNVLAALGAPDVLVRDARAAAVVPPGPYGRRAVRDILIVEGKLSPAAGEVVPGGAQITGVLREVAEKDRAQLGDARSALDQAVALQRLLVDKFGPERATDLAPLTDVLRVVAQVCDTARGVPDAADAAAQLGVAGESGAALPGGGEIRSRDEALRSLDKVCAYLERTEPASPAPLLIRRAQRLMTMSFVQIIEDMAPDGLTQVRTVAGIRGE
jgi:type VI secretion system protein ImpA